MNNDADIDIEDVYRMLGLRDVEIYRQRLLIERLTEEADALRGDAGGRRRGATPGGDAGGKT